MPAAVVPAQVALLTTRGLEHGQNAFDITRGTVFIIHFDFTAEKVGRWHLPSIADHHYLLATHNRAKGINRLNLRGFVEHHHIELQLARRQEVGN
ncbi:hypothetical protein D3C85_1464520 [compost metagenome]